MDGALQVRKTCTVLTRSKELLENVHVPCCGAVGHRIKKGDWGEKQLGGDTRALGASLGWVGMTIAQKMWHSWCFDSREKTEGNWRLNVIY